MSSVLIILNLQSSQIPSGLSVSFTPHILQIIKLKTYLRNNKVYVLKAIILRSNKNFCYDS